MKQRYDVVIAGAGMVGLSLACLLVDDERLRITIVDAGKRPEFDADGDVSLRVSAVSPGSVELLQRVGAWQMIAGRRRSPYRRMTVWDARGTFEGADALSFDAAEFAVPELGFIVENELIRQALLDRLGKTGASLRFETTISDAKRVQDRMQLQLASHESLVPDLLVAADGAGSFVRQAADIRATSWPYPQKAFVTHLRPERAHRQTAWQRFLPEGPIGILPLQDGRVSVVWSTVPAHADALVGMPDDELAEQLTAGSDGVLGRLMPAGLRGAFPLQAQYANAYVQPGLALAGDAAHAVHPLAGQGVNLGFADAQVLARVMLAALDDGENPGDMPVLRRYERARKGPNQTMLFFIDGIERLFSNDKAALSQLRRAGLYLFNKSGPLRERVVQTALGFR